ncbi:MAG: Tic20 family protein [Cyanobacteria bacterium P01_D01_bin.105]
MNGSAPALDRAFAALSYVMPLAAALNAGSYFFNFLSVQAPQVLRVFLLLLAPLQPLIAIENGILGFAVFILLFLFVIRNTNISRFIRFNVLQAILVSFMISITLLVLGALNLLGNNLLGETLSNVMFLGGMVIVVYSVAQSVMGRYAEIPTISDAVNAQMPY